MDKVLEFDACIPGPLNALLLSEAASLRLHRADEFVRGKPQGWVLNWAYMGLLT